jgi:hypothetical protein
MYTNLRNLLRWKFLGQKWACLEEEEIGSPDIGRKGKWKRTNSSQRTGICSGEMHIVADVTSSF